MVYNIQNPVDIGIDELHTLSKVEKLDRGMKLQLLNIMYALKGQSQFELIRDRNTRAAEKYTFATNIVNLDIYARSPYFVGAKLWDNLPLHIQNIDTKAHFKKSLKRIA